MELLKTQREGIQTALNEIELKKTTYETAGK
jgi:hypothetical protein